MSKLLDEALELEFRGDGRYARRVDHGPFWGMVTPHGGYLMALMLHAMQSELGRTAPGRRPRAFTQHFLGLIEPGAEIHVDVEVELVRRSVASLSARMRTATQLVGLATALFSSEGEGPSFLDDPMPEVAPPGEPDRNLMGFMAPVHETYAFHRRFGRDGVVVPVEDGGWIVPTDEGAWDHRLALVASDLWVPPVIRHPDRVCATPSLHHAVHFGPDVGGETTCPMLIHLRMSSGGEGITEEDIGLWAEDGRLLLRARQIRSVVPTSKAVGA